MMDDDRPPAAGPAQLLRERLDHELAPIHATAAARARLAQRTADLAKPSLAGQRAGRTGPAAGWRARRAGSAVGSPSSRAGSGSGWRGGRVGPVAAGWGGRRAGSGFGLRGGWLPSGAGVPLAAGFAAAAVVIGAVAVPVYLRAGQASTEQPGTDQPAPGSATSSPIPPTHSLTPEPTPRATATPNTVTRAAAEAEAKAAKASKLAAKLKAAKAYPPLSTLTIATVPSSASVGQRITVRVVVVGPVSRYGDLTVIWDDGTTATTVPGSCQRPAPVAKALATLSHAYLKPGKYRISAQLDRCESSPSAVKLILVSSSIATPKPSSS